MKTGQIVRFFLWIHVLISKNNIDSMLKANKSMYWTRFFKSIWNINRQHSVWKTSLFDETASNKLNNISKTGIITLYVFVSLPKSLLLFVVQHTLCLIFFGKIVCVTSQSAFKKKKKSISFWYVLSSNGNADTIELTMNRWTL